MEPKQTKQRKGEEVSSLVRFISPGIQKIQALAAGGGGSVRKENKDALVNKNPPKKEKGKKNQKIQEMYSKPQKSPKQTVRER